MDTAAMAAWVIIVVALALLTVEVPILLFLLAPGWTVPKLQDVNGWLDRDGHTCWWPWWGDRAVEVYRRSCWRALEQC